MAKRFICSPTEPVVQTKAGRLRGFIYDGTYTFYGIKYADAKRFQMPTEVEPWDDIKDATTYGSVCPMLESEKAMGELMVPHRFWPKDENCQYLNIWTQSISSGAKKPVMVWLHGGGFAMGSSIEQVAYDGENMSKNGDVVVVSLNHRLNILGYLDLSPFGEKYANSGNAGNADMVAALQWIKDNIAHFGGDPENVTLFGQSGGGMKIWTLLQTPKANGLFHKGIIQSGVLDGFSASTKGNGTDIVTALLDELNLTKQDVEKLETIPYETLSAAYKKVFPSLAAKGSYIGGMPMANDFYLGDPLDVGFTEHASTLPIIIGSVMGEFAFFRGVTDKYDLSEDAIRPMIVEKYGQASDQLIDLFHAAYPSKNLADLLVLDSLFRSPSKAFIKERAQQLATPIYSYIFTYEFPYDGGKPAWHCSEIPFIFHNTDKVPICQIPGVSDILEKQMFNAWIQFAYTGNPNHKDLPLWSPCSPDKEYTMLFDRKCEVRENFDDALIELHKEVAPKFTFGKEEILH